MNLWERVTGTDITRDWKSFDNRAEALPGDLRAAWDRIKAQLLPHSDFSGRNLTPILDDALSLLEQAAADGESAQEVLGDDIDGFAAALAGGEGAPNFRDRWRKQLNSTVARRLARLGD